MTDSKGNIRIATNEFRGVNKGDVFVVYLADAGVQASKFLYNYQIYNITQGVSQDIELVGESIEFHTNEYPKE